MSLKERLESLGTLVKSILALLALLPGIAVLTGLIDIPPTLIQLVKFLSIFVSLVVLIAILLLQKRLARLPLLWVAGLAVVAVAVGGAVAVGYWTFANRHIVVVAKGKQVTRYVVPLKPSAEVRSLVEPYDGDYAEALVTSVYKERLARLLSEDSGGTVAVMILLLVLAQTLLISGIVVGGWRLVTDDEAAPATKSPVSAAPAPPPAGEGAR